MELTATTRIGKTNREGEDFTVTSGGMVRSEGSAHAPLLLDAGCGWCESVLPHTSFLLAGRHGSDADPRRAPCPSWCVGVAAVEISPG